MSIDPNVERFYGNYPLGCPRESSHSGCTGSCRECDYFQVGEVVDALVKFVEHNWGYEEIQAPIWKIQREVSFVMVRFKIEGREAYTFVSAIRKIDPNDISFYLPKSSKLV